MMPALDAKACHRAAAVTRRVSKMTKATKVSEPFVAANESTSASVQSSERAPWASLSVLGLTLGQAGGRCAKCPLYLKSWRRGAGYNASLG